MVRIINTFNPIQSLNLTYFSESDFIDSTFSLGGFIGSLVYGLICDRIGRKLSLHLVAFPQLLSFLLIAFSQNSMMILLSRLFAGFSGGLLCLAVPLFVSEIAEDV
jgi:MFS family permease